MSEPIVFGAGGAAAVDPSGAAAKAYTTGPNGATSRIASVGNPEVRNSVNQQISGLIDKQLNSIVQKSLSPSVDITKVALLSLSIKTNLNSKLSSLFGTSGSVSAGGKGGSAGGGLSLSAGAGIGAGMAGGVSGKVGGVATGGLSLGFGLGTRASFGVGGGTVLLGTSPSGDFGPGGALTRKQPEIRMGDSAKISNSLIESIGISLDKTGLTVTEKRQIKSDLVPAINEAVENSFKSAFSGDLGYPNSSGAAILSCEITMMDRGNWSAILELDVEDGVTPSPSGPFIFDIDGVEYRGTIDPDRSGVWAGRNKVRVVGGAGGLARTAEPKNYAGGLTKARTVIDDIMRDSGEALSKESDSQILDMKLQSWQRAAGKYSDCLDALAKKLDFQWRVLRDGTIWIGKDKWPEIEPSGTIVDHNRGYGIIRVAPDYATIVPGVMVRGQLAKQVTYKLDHNGLRAELHSNSTRSLTDKFVERARRETEYAYRYRCKVVRQNSDGTVDVLTDDDRMKGRGIGKCRIRVGTPGTTIKVPEGARCLVGWDDGDPSLPYVGDWEMGTAFTSIDFG